MLRTENLKKYYTLTAGVLQKKELLKALDGVSIAVSPDHVFAVVGESGCGKSTLARVVLRLTEPTDGAVFFRNEDISRLKGDRLKQFRKSIQVIFQDPFASLNPRMNVFSILSEPLKIHNLVPKRELRDGVADLLRSVGLKPEYMNRYPHEFSGGQRQRISIARALSVSPEMIVADEPLSSLDVSIQAQILNLLDELKKNKRLSFIFISHDLNVVHYFADVVAVMHAGRIVEEAEAEIIFQHPRHPYTVTLLESIPKLRRSEGNRNRRPGPAGAHNPDHSSGGCSFYSRCPDRRSLCGDVAPPLKDGGDRRVACHLF